MRKALGIAGKIVYVCEILFVPLHACRAFDILYAKDLEIIGHFLGHVK